ncbi:MAG TPA: PIG-L family deacetylase [Vicinamibacterales bacterium]|nr:PIG-L family deacetylase [Vicinamibacterales bacterium]
MRTAIARLVFLLTLVPCAQASAQPAGAPPLNLSVNRATRLLVIAPHPDDDVLGAGGLIRRVVTAGGSVRVVWTTSGDGFPEGVETAEGISPRVAHLTPRDYETYGRLREEEALAALGSLGVKPNALTFLGFPDEGLCELASTYLSAKAQAFKSPYTGRISPPLTEQVIHGVRYRGFDLRRELERVIVAFGPTLIAAPHPEDTHPDHCSTHIFLTEALSELSKAGRVRPRVLHYLIHYGQWPLRPYDVAGDVLLPPKEFPPLEGRWASLALTPDEIGAKRVALLLYHSQMLVIGRLLLAFARSNELYLEGEPASLPECWCNGQNVATEAPPSRYRHPPPRR